MAAVDVVLTVADEDRALAGVEVQGVERPGDGAALSSTEGGTGPLIVVKCRASPRCSRMSTAALCVLEVATPRRCPAADRRSSSSGTPS